MCKIVHYLNTLAVNLCVCHDGSKAVLTNYSQLTLRWCGIGAHVTIRTLCTTALQQRSHVSLLLHFHFYF